MSPQTVRKLCHMPPNPHTLKPFKKGDPRINRDGRPKNSGELSALFRRIGHEPATKKNGEPVIGPDGRPMTVLEVIARQWAQDAKKQEAFIERGFGKVATPVDVTSKGERITGFVQVSPTDWENDDGDETAGA